MHQELEACYLNTFYENKRLPSEVSRLQSQWISPLQDCSFYYCLRFSEGYTD